MTGSVPTTSEDGVGVIPPNNSYLINDIPEDGVELLPEDQNVQDPMLLLSAQLQNSLYVTSRSTFRTNVPETVYKNFEKSQQTIAKMVASSIRDEYKLLGQVGQEERCMFGLEKIALHLREVISKETFFNSLRE
ncbi:hypothetical protein CAEBREN_16332 [Caenorhabditis brenneri]|uniref:Uncharacterized protein n=1 Tax=Caenorhabditis brenneri TaxID=135651 RepID=G0M7C9_CAEBE|nr:hypothetical protein CAEBREN_16332 [Caenorhabditis brenneri]